jgi:predicted GIY-YIG superfamily endonuclease
LDTAAKSIYVYVLKSEKHWRFYVGLANDVEVRLKEHNNGKTKSTRPYKPSYCDVDACHIRHEIVQ